MTTTNHEYFVTLLKDHPAAELSRHDLASAADLAKLSPYFTYATRAGLIERTNERGCYRKLPALDAPIAELVKSMTLVQHKSYTAPRRPKITQVPDAPVEVDVHEVLDQLPVEAIFDVLSAKINLLSAQAAPLAHEVTALRDQLAIKEGKIQSLKVEIGRLEDKQRVLNAENARLTALMTNTKADRTVLVKPLNAQGTGVFRDGERRTIVLRKQEGGQ